MQLGALKTPSLILDPERVRRNAERMTERVRSLGVSLRPHVKTHKCVEVARLQTAGHSGAITVSTLAEARAFAARGFTDILYAVPLDPGKFAEVIDLAKDCECLGVITCDRDVPAALNARASAAGITLDVHLKVDCGYHRAGVDPQSDEAIGIARSISDASHLRFAGILTHAGHSYHARSASEVLAVAREERDVMAGCAERLRAAGIEVPVVSVGSTPTMTHVDHLAGIDEARPGNYIFYDAFQATLGSCAFADCALSVLAAVIHRDRARGRVVIDAGAIALSKDRGPVDLDPSCGYGRVLDLDGNDLGLRVESMSQEHGILSGATDDLLDRLPVGTRLRVLANHSCLTAAQHDAYHLVDGDRIIDRWQILRGW